MKHKILIFAALLAVLACANANADAANEQSIQSQTTEPKKILNTSQESAAKTEYETLIGLLALIVL